MAVTSPRARAAGPAQTSEFTITAYPDFPYVEVRTPIPFQLQSSLLTKHLDPTGKPCTSSTYPRAPASREVLRHAVLFGDTEWPSYPPAVPRQISLHSIQFHTHISAAPEQQTLLIDSAEMTETELSKLSWSRSTFSFALTKVPVMFNSLTCNRQKILGEAAMETVGI